MKNLGTSARRSMTVAFGVGAALTIGLAFAAWVQTGTGSGSARSISAQDSVVTTDTVTATANADLYPGATGATAGDVYFKVTNPNPYPVKFTSMAVGTVTSSDEATCPAANVTVAGKSGLALTVPANTNTAAAVAHKIDGVVAMLKTAPNGCQGKTFTIGLTLTGESD